MPWRVLLAVVAGFALLAAACADDDDGGEGDAEGLDGQTVQHAEHDLDQDVPAVPPEVDAASDEWPMGGRDYANTRATTDSPIDSSTIDQLEVAWELPIDGAGDWGALASTPVILDGVAYVQDLLSNVYAVEVDSGEVRWETRFARTSIGPNGVAVGYGKVYLQDGTDSLIALDMEDGEELWSLRIRPHTGTHQPVVYDGYVYTGTGAGVPGEGPEDAGGRDSYVGGASGRVFAVHQETGELSWEFQVVEEGFWGDPENNGGGGLWYPPTIDVDRGVSYWGTGNPAPFPGTAENPNAVTRPGDNLYTNSIVALDLVDGGLDWYFQAKPRDLFDLDYQNSPVLATVEDPDAGERDLVFGSGKVGEVHAVDADSGELVWELQVGEHQNADLQQLPLDEEVVVMPGVWGGVETPIAYHDGTLYVLTINLPSPWTATGFDAEVPGDAVAAAEGRTNLEDAESVMYAIDAATGEVDWERAFDEPSFGGATVVNDLVLTAMLDGRMVALDRGDGSTVWEHQAPGGVIAWPAIAGDTIVWPVGLGREPRVMAFQLGGDG